MALMPPNPVLAFAIANKCCIIFAYAYNAWRTYAYVNHNALGTHSNRKIGICLACQARLVILSERERAKNLGRPNGEILRPRKRGLRMTTLNTYENREGP